MKRFLIIPFTFLLSLGVIDCGGGSNSGPPPMLSSMMGGSVCSANDMMAQLQALPQQCSSMSQIPMMLLAAQQQQGSSGSGGLSNMLPMLMAFSSSQNNTQCKPIAIPQPAPTPVPQVQVPGQPAAPAQQPAQQCPPPVASNCTPSCQNGISNIMYEAAHLMLNNHQPWINAGGTTMCLPGVFVTANKCWLIKALMPTLSAVGAPFEQAGYSCANPLSGSCSNLMSTFGPSLMSFGQNFMNQLGSSSGTSSLMGGTFGSFASALGTPSQTNFPALNNLPTNGTYGIGVPSARGIAGSNPNPLSMGSFGIPVDQIATLPQK